MFSRTGLAGVAGRLWHAPTLLLSLAALFWSGNFIVGRAVRESVPPVALSFWRWQLIGPNRAGQFLHLMPVFGSLLAVGLLGERLELHHLLGIGLIGLGLLLGVRGGR